MKCELCNRNIQQGEVAHGIKYGTTDHDNQVFLPARDSAWTVVCSTCGDMLCKLIYSKLVKPTINPTIYKTFTQSR